MEQNTNTGVPMTPIADNKQNSGNGLKIATAIACIVAVCGIGFGVYSIMQISDKDSQITNKDNQIADLKTQIEGRGTAEPTCSPITEGGNEGFFNANVLNGIKNNITNNEQVFGSDSYACPKDSDQQDLYLKAYIRGNGDLFLGKGLKNHYTIATNAVFTKFVGDYNEYGYSSLSLYFVRSDGSLGVIRNLECNTETQSVVEEIPTTSKIVYIQQITPVNGIGETSYFAIGIDGNFIKLPDPYNHD